MANPYYLILCTSTGESGKCVHADKVRVLSLTGLKIAKVYNICNIYAHFLKKYKPINKYRYTYRHKTSVRITRNIHLPYCTFLYCLKCLTSYMHSLVLSKDIN